MISGQKKPLISIISINFNCADATREMLDSVRKVSYPNLEVIVVDNGSTKPGFDSLATDYLEFQFYKTHKNLGFAGGNNFGYFKSSGEYIFFLNNDASLTEGCLEKLMLELERDSKIGIVSPIIFNTKNKNSDPDIIQFAGTTHVSRITGRNSTIGEGEKYTAHYLQSKITAYAHGCAMMVPRKVIEKAGLIPEPFFLYYEELDWCERIRDAGFEIRLVPEAKVYHHESLTIGSDSPMKTYYINRSRVLFMRRNSTRIQFAGFVLFMIFFTIPKNTLTFAVKGKFANLSAFLKALAWNFSDSLKSTSSTTTPLQNFDKNRSSKVVSPQLS